MAQYESGLQNNIFKIRHNNQPICVTFGTPHPVESCLMAGRQELDAILVNHVLKILVVAQNNQLSALFY